MSPKKTALDAVIIVIAVIDITPNNLYIILLVHKKNGNVISIAIPKLLVFQWNPVGGTKLVVNKILLEAKESISSLPKYEEKDE